MSDQHLVTYVRDHLAMIVGGIELARRTLSENRSTEWAAALEALMPALEDDRATLRLVLDVLGGRPSTVKGTAAWIGEKLGRLKMNDRVTGYSELSRLEELEGLALLTEARVALWAALARARQDDERLVAVDFGLREAAAREQLEALRALQVEAAGAALAR